MMTISNVRCVGYQQTIEMMSLKLDRCLFTHICFLHLLNPLVRTQDCVIEG
jgi:hypothetical protein